MTSFIQDVIVDLQKRELDISQLTFILPSKRAGTFLKHILSEQISETMFAPEIIAIEEFVESISDINFCTNTEALFEFYNVYVASTPKEQIESFDTFSKWGQMLLQDFNEIDRYLITSNHIFEYLKAIKDINHWSLADEQTAYVKNYISFWHRLKTYYNELKAELISKKKGYQGLVYKEAVGALEHYIESNTNKKHVFIGFNALNKAEEIIIQELLQQDLALIYWDIDATFINNPIHDAGLFTRQHKSNWPYFKNQPFNWITNHYTSEKNIQCIGISKNVGQVKYIGELLEELHSNQKSLQNTAVVLGDETLLMPLINSITEQIKAVNITMGLPLKSVPLASLFEELFKIHKTPSSQFYHKDITSIVSHQFIKPLLDEGFINYADNIINHIQETNKIVVSTEKLALLASTKADVIELLFSSWQNPNQAIETCFKLIQAIKKQYDENKDANRLGLEYLYRFNEVFNELQSLNATYNHIDSIKTLHGLYKELLKSETLDFKGEPLEGLQIMGMLESRVLDFETVIMSSVNEGILPAGKSMNSFIPFDVKLENGLPTYKEKDAVYTYHFYRLLQRAKNVYIIYNTEPDVLNGGEKSRFITQLDIENIHHIQHKTVTPKVPSIVNLPKFVKKTDAILNRIKEIAEKGFSPSSLTNYIRNPIDFYYEKILKIATFEEVEETVAANTLGSVIHQTLEDFYKPFINQMLTKAHLETMLTSIDSTVTQHFKALYKEGDMSKGKNLIIFEITKRYVHNFIQKELECVENGDQIKIIALEKQVNAVLEISELHFPIRLKGTVDRIDECNGTLRIIDYKTGKVEQSKVEIVNWEDLTTDYDKYSKSFQVLAYAYMLNYETPFTTPVEAGIISFKNLQGDYFLKFAKKDGIGRGSNKDQLISTETLDAFYAELKSLILEICNPDVDFVEKEV
jgi:hypothetical protein